MFRIFTYILFLSLSFGFGQNITFPDSNFKNALLNHSVTIDTNSDGEISLTEARAYTGTIDVSYQNISDLTGIEAFTSLKRLDCLNNQLTSLDISLNTLLEEVNCRFNQLTSLDTSFNTSLKKLDVYRNRITSLDLSLNKDLVDLNCQDNQLTVLNVDANTALKTLNCGGNQLSRLNLSFNTGLEDLFCSVNQLSSIDVTSNVLLKTLSCSNNPLNTLDVSKNILLEGLLCAAVQLSNLDVSKNINLTSLNFTSNQLTTIDLSNNTLLTFLSCSFNQLTGLDLSSLSRLNLLECRSNQLTMLNLANGNNANFTRMWADGNINLTCIQHDSGFNPASVNTFNWRKDGTASWNVNCVPLSSDIIKLDKQISYVIDDDGVFHLSSQDLEPKRITFYNLYGQKVIETVNREIDINNLTQTLYFVKIAFENGQDVIVKIVKD